MEKPLIAGIHLDHGQLVWGLQGDIKEALTEAEKQALKSLMDQAGVIVSKGILKAKEKHKKEVSTNE